MSKILWVIAGLAGLGAVYYLVKRGQDEGDGGGVAGDIWRGLAGDPSSSGSLSNLLGSGLYGLGLGSNPFPNGVQFTDLYGKTSSDADKKIAALVNKHNSGQLLTGSDLDEMGTWMTISSSDSSALWASVKMIWDWYHAESTIE